MLVVVIIGVLAALTIHRVPELKQTVYVDVELNDLQGYAIAEELFFNEHDRYADTTELRLAGFRFSHGVVADSQRIEQSAHELHISHRSSEVTCGIRIEVGGQNRPICDLPNGTEFVGGAIPLQ